MGVGGGVWRQTKYEEEEKKKNQHHPIIKHMKSHRWLQNLNDVCGNSLFSHHMPMKGGRKKGTIFFTTDLHLYLGHIWTVTSEKMETLLKALEKHIRFHTRFFFFNVYSWYSNYSLNFTLRSIKWEALSLNQNVTNDKKMPDALNALFLQHWRIHWLCWEALPCLSLKSAYYKRIVCQQYCF